MSDRFEIFNQFVDTTDVSQALLDVGLNDDEAERAALTVARHRAQFVVDSVLQNVLGRKDELEETAVSLNRQLHETRTELSLIYEMTGFDPIVIDGAELDHPKDDGLDYCSNWKDFERRVEPKQPLVLWFRRSLGLQDRTNLDLRSWVKNHEEAIRAKYGDGQLKVFTRASRLVYYGVERNLARFTTHDFSDESGQEWLGVEMQNIRAFLSNYGGERFGVKSAVAIVRIADMQKDEFPVVSIDAHEE